MIRQKILQQLLEWIECNLEHPISIEDIAQKSGYSRRNIQLLFRNFMHVPLGEYIRKRRLCRAAILVRLSAKSMLDIALSLHFDSQQSFSREFKKLFGCSPREYRHRDYWDLANIFPSFLYVNSKRRSVDQSTFLRHLFLAIHLNMILKCRINYRMKKSNCDVIIQSDV